MATRTFKLWGAAYSDDGNVSITVNFNNSQVFSGTVDTIPGDIPTDVSTEFANHSYLCSWTGDTSLTGTVPVTIAVTGGDMIWEDILANYTCYELQEDSDGNPVVVDGNYVAVAGGTPEEMIGNLNINDAASDGKTNISWTNRNDWNTQRDVTNNPDMLGDWAYRICDGQTISADFDISVLVESLPTYQADAGHV